MRYFSAVAGYSEVDEPFLHVQMADKVVSRKMMKEAGIPTILGMHLTRGDIKKVGYPVNVKAPLSGDGKGMRVVQNEKELEDSLCLQEKERQNLVSEKSQVSPEKYIEQPRHILDCELKVKMGEIAKEFPMDKGKNFYSLEFYFLFWLKRVSKRRQNGV